MTRRRIALLGLAAFGVLAALVPWTIRSERVVDAMARQIAQGYGITLTSKGRLTLTLLPLPQFVLSGVRLVSRDGTVEVEADELRAQPQFLPLLRARMRLRKLWMARSSIAITLLEVPSITAGGTLARLRNLLGAGHEAPWVPRIDRFILTEAEIGFRDRAGSEISRLKGASLDLASPEPGGDLGLTASARWNGETVFASLSGVNLGAVRAGSSHPVEGELSSRLGRVSLEGRLVWSERAEFTGTFRGQTASLGRLARWSELGGDLAAVDRPVTVSGDGSLDLDKLQWPRAQIEFGRDRLDGALAIEFGARPQARATFASEDLDLSWLGSLSDPPDGWRLGANYDIRLSSSALTLGPLRLRDAALSVQSTRRAIEISLGRATLAGGSLRGRLSALLDTAHRDIRALAWVEDVDLGGLSSELSAFRAASGIASGQLTLDITGNRAAELARQVRGRGSVQIREGEFAILAATGAAKRASQAPPPPDWRAGRVRFARTALGLDIRDGRVELVDGVIETAGTKARLSGGIDLDSRNAALRLSIRPNAASGAEPTLLDLNGPLPRLTLGAAAAAEPDDP